MRAIALCAVLSLFLLSSCSLLPSPEEKAVRDSYNKIADALEQGDFSTAFDCMSTNTRQFLDDLADALTFYEMPMGADGRELFGQMLSEADMTDLSRDIKSVTINGTAATVVTVTEEGDETLAFVLENGQWNLDFEQLIRDAMDEGLAGAGFTVQDLLDHTVPTEGGGSVTSVEYGDGSCPVDITNGLGSYDIWYAYVSLSSESEWGDDALGSQVLAPGGKLTIWVDPGTYDIMVEDVDGDTYSRYNVEIGPDGYAWEVTLSDMD